ncbi:MAG: Trk system potassium transporter TrkA [Eubacteriales bacterium]|nr:Trk system potassium transporter TrkA [Eubacteriales bacterium]
MDIIIVGSGRVGRTIADHLNLEGHSITVIDENVAALEKLSDTQNIMTIEGNGATLNTLKEANVSSCDLLIAVTATDELNLYTCLIAKNAGVKRTIARVRNPQYTKDLPFVKDDLKLSLAINPELLCSRELTRMLKFPGVESITSFARGHIDLIKIKVDDKSVLCNKKIVQCSNILKEGVRFCIVEREGECYIPNGDFVINEGDFISFIAPSKVAAKLLKSLGIVSNRGRSVMLLGGSKIAYYLARDLLDAGISVRIIESDKARCIELSEMLDDALIIHGDAMDQDLLLSEGIEHSNAIVTLMNTDEENLVSSLYAKQINPKAQIITEIGNLKISSVFDNLPLDTMFNPKRIAGEHIMRYVRAMHNSRDSEFETVHPIANGKAEALEFRVRKDSLVTGIALSALDIKANVQIACINRQGKMIIPKGSDTIEIGDTVIVVTKHKGLSDLEDILR